MKRLLLFLALVGSAHAAGSVQQSLQPIGTSSTGQPTSYVLAFTWTGDASTGTVPATVGQGLSCCQGWFPVQVETSPGSPNPTNGYSVTITDSAGFDILAGAASSLSSTNPQSFATSTAATPIQGALTLNITGQSVAGAKGTVYLFMNRPGVVNTAKLGTGISSSANWLTIANSPFVDPRSYNFTAQTPGVALTGGSGATITMIPCPVGVAGADTNHYLYIQNGTGGAAEPVLITGGTCTSGASSGTITFTPTNSHGGAWTIQSATAGIQEAVNIANAGSLVYLPQLTNVYACTYIAKAVMIAGSGMNFGSQITQNTNTQCVFNNTNNGPSADFRDFVAIYATQAANNVDAIVMQGTAGGPINGGNVTKVQVVKAYNCLHLIDAQHINVWGVLFQQYGNNGMQIDQNFGFSGDNMIGQGATFLGSQSLGNAGIQVNKNSILTVTDCKFNGGNYAIEMTYPTGFTGGGLYVNRISAENHNTYAILLQAASAGSLFDVSIQNSTLDQPLFNTAWNGIVFAPGAAAAVAHVKIAGNRFEGMAGRSVTMIGILFGGGGTSDSVQIQDNEFFNLDNAVFGAGANTNIFVTHSNFTAVTTPFNSSGTSPAVDQVQSTNFTGLGNIGTVASGSRIYVTDANNLCSAGSSTGQECFRVNGSWVAAFTNPAPTVAFASLPAVPAAGGMIYCTNCLAGSSPCSGASTGHMAISDGTHWQCN